MKPEPGSLAERWLRQAERDLDDARYVLTGERYSLACFLAQQCVEKAVKAFLYARGAQAVWGHSVADLCREASGLDPDFQRLGKEVAYLDRYYLPTRYPDSLPGGIPADAYRRSDAEGAVTTADGAVGLVRRKLGLRMESP